MAKLIAHWVLGDRLYCADSEIHLVGGHAGDKVAQCPVCFDRDRPHMPLAVTGIRTESLDDYINRLFGED